MKKLVAILAAVLVSNSLISSTYAHQDRSFLNAATSGIFEENYDLFKISPAYLPGFQKNAFWGQLSNLFNQSETIVGGASSSYYLLGGHMDMMGMGRAGLMGDWYSYSTPQNSTTWNGSTTAGFNERSTIQYLDRNNDEIIDKRTETYGRSEKTTNRYTNDIYVAYGLGDIAGLDLGLGVRGNWNSYQPSYNNSTPMGPTYGSFKDFGWERQTDLVTNQLLFTYDRECTKGTLSYGNSEWQAILAARSKDTFGMMPNMDLLVNLSPVITARTNEYEWNFQEYTNYYPTSTSQIQDYRRIQSEKGFESAAGSTPSNGMGVAAAVRLDLATSFTGAKELNNNIITDLGFQTVGNTLVKDKAKKETIDHQINRVTQWDAVNLRTLLSVNDYTSTINDSNEGTGGETSMYIKSKALWKNQGWDFGIGISAASSMDDSETTNTYAYNATTRQEYQNAASTAGNYTEVTTSRLVTVSKTKNVYNDIDLPVAMQFNFLKNFAVQIGANHNISLNQSDSSSRTKERQLETTIRTNDNGTQTSTVPADSGTLVEASSASTFTVTQSTSFSYGITWWPYEQVRIDFTGLNDITLLGNYRFSASLYF